MPLKASAHTFQRFTSRLSLSLCTYLLSYGGLGLMRHKTIFNACFSHPHEGLGG